MKTREMTVLGGGLESASLKMKPQASDGIATPTRTAISELQSTSLAHLVSSSPPRSSHAIPPSFQHTQYHLSRPVGKSSSVSSQEPKMKKTFGSSEGSRSTRHKTEDINGQYARCVTDGHLNAYEEEKKKEITEKSDVWRWDGEIVG